MSGAGFNVQLFPSWREAVAEHDYLNQQTVNESVKNMGRFWLDSCGYSEIFDPDNCGFEKDPTNPPGPNARPLYEPQSSIRIRWGEWGPEHITVPGNACGLDISDGIFAPYAARERGKVLVPHNVDSKDQALLLLIIFTWFADCLILDQLTKSHNTLRVENL